MVLRNCDGSFFGELVARLFSSAIQFVAVFRRGKTGSHAASSPKKNTAPVPQIHLVGFFGMRVCSSSKSAVSFAVVLLLLLLLLNYDYSLAALVVLWKSVEGGSALYCQYRVAFCRHIT